MTKKKWGSKAEVERRNRILVSLYAYAYEFEDDSIVPDKVFDAMCMEIRPKIKTGNEILDKFFREEFDPFTGMWIHKHPELDKLKHYYKTYHQL